MFCRKIWDPDPPQHACLPSGGGSSPGHPKGRGGALARERAVEVALVEVWAVQGPCRPRFAVPWVTSCGQDRYKPWAEQVAREGLFGGGVRTPRREGAPGLRSTSQPLLF